MPGPSAGLDVLIHRSTQQIELDIAQIASINLDLPVLKSRPPGFSFSELHIPSCEKVSGMSCCIQPSFVLGQFGASRGR
jgi:hypothetical protein